MALMLEQARRTVVQMDRREVWSFAPDGPCPTLYCASGACWVTQAGDCADYHLRAGEQLALQARGRVVAEALAPTRLHLLAEPHTAPAA